MNITITLTDADVARLKQIRKLREADGRPWSSDIAMISSVVSLGLHQELISEKAYVEARENPMRINERGSIELLMRQAM